MHRLAGFTFLDDSTGLDQVGSGAAVESPVKPRLVRRRYGRRPLRRSALPIKYRSRLRGEFPLPFFRSQGCHQGDRQGLAFAIHRSTG
jgi:hypothetical protein